MPPSDVRSIWCMHACVQGNCSSEPSAMALGLSEPPLVGRKPGQCVLVTVEKLLEAGWDLWMDNLYIRLANVDNLQVRLEAGTGTLLSASNIACNLWLTSVTLQGDSSQPVGPSGVHFFGGNMYAEGVHTSSLSSLHLSLTSLLRFKATGKLPQTGSCINCCSDPCL
jgi:hypothetical protein